jgi:hypothetical protein
VDVSATSLTGKWWRGLFLLAAAGIFAGGPLHPKGSMAEMLGNPNWVPAHSLMLVGFVALLIALLLFRRRSDLPESTRKWTLYAIIGATLQAIEMALHDASVVDRAHLIAGEATPVLTTHLSLAVVVYPIFAVTLGGFIIAGARDHTVGSKWIGWLGILGLAAHGASAPLVVAAHVPAAATLFALITLFALWMILAALWPLPTLRDPDSRIS